MVMATGLGIHVGLNVPQALPASQLRHHQGDELVPAADLAQSLSLMVLLGQGLELMEVKL